MESCACTTNSAMIVLCAALSSEHIFSVDTFCPVGCSLCRFFPLHQSRIYVVFSPLCRMHIMRANVALKLHVNSPNYRRNAIHIRNIHIILFCACSTELGVFMFLFSSLFPPIRQISFHAGNYCRSDNSLAYTHVSTPTSRFHIFECSISREKTAERRGWCTEW